jgi:hypothetical protein
MSDEYNLTTFLYFGSMVAIILIILTVLQLYHFGKNRNAVSDIAARHIRHYNKSPSDIARDLEQIRDLLLKSSRGLTENNSLHADIDSAIKSLAAFINENPRLNSTTLCSIEMKNNLINTEMDNSITYDDNAYAKSYNHILEFDEEERNMHDDPREHLKFLIKNINIAISLLKSSVCNNGYLNINKLKQILYKLNDQIVNTGSMHYKGKTITYNKDPYTRYDKPPSVPLFASITSTSEPFDSKPTVLRSGLRSQYTENMSQLQFANDYTAPHAPYMPGDGSFEGTVEQDISSGRPFGQMINRTSDPSHYYTVRSGACGGTTPSDDQFLTQCLGKDIQLEQALNGNPNSMLDCIGDCTSEPNYFRWYKQLDMTSAGMDARGIDDYN